MTSCEVSSYEMNALMMKHKIEKISRCTEDKYCVIPLA